IQLDMKVTGLPGEVLVGALDQAKEARLQILEVLRETIPVPRTEVNPKAPRILTIKIPVDKIGEVIGPKGKKINEIVALTGADIDIQDDGTVFVGAREAGGADEAAGSSTRSPTRARSAWASTSPARWSTRPRSARS